MYPSGNSEQIKKFEEILKDTVQSLYYSIKISKYKYYDQQVEIVSK